MTAQLVTLTTAKVHLRVTDSNSDVIIQDKLDMAEAICLEWCGVDSVADLIVERYWVEQAGGSPTLGSPPSGSPQGSPVDDWVDTNTTDLQVKTLTYAILVTLSNMYDNTMENPLTPGVKNLLRRWRQPVIAGV